MSVWAPQRHEPVVALPWDADRAREAAIAIARETRDAFDETRLWKLHPEDTDEGEPPDRIDAALYVGAAGTLEGLAALERLAGPLDVADLARATYRAARAGALYSEYASGSYMIGIAASALAAGSYAGDESALDTLYRDAEATIGTDARELFAGSAGELFAVRLAFERTGDTRFKELAARLASELDAALEEYADGVRLWTIHLYRSVWGPFLGAGHGFAGIAHALLCARSIANAALDFDAFQRSVALTVRSTAVRANGTANWPAIYGCESLPGEGGRVTRLQWCHGAAGIVTSLNAIPAGVDPEFDELLSEAGEATWQAGPPLGDAGLCHGAAGSGWAFLKLHRRTGEALWLDRARTFAMHALETMQKRRTNDGSVWPSLLTGDVGTAVYLAACLDLDDRFPALER